MHQHVRNVPLLWVALVLVGALVLGACGGDEPAADATVGTTSAEGTTDGPGVERSVDDGDLLVARDYLQGEWCDNDGQTWSIDGDTAKVENATGAAAELPVDLVFFDDVESELVSQTDTEFTIVSAGDEITFTRGGC